MDVGQVDPSQAFALASIWILFLAFGGSACLLPIIYTVGQAYQDAFNSGLSYSSQASALELLATANGILFMVLGSVIGYPVASASGNLFLSIRKEVYRRIDTNKHFESALFIQQALHSNVYLQQSILSL